MAATALLFCVKIFFPPANTGVGEALKLCVLLTDLCVGSCCRFIGLLLLLALLQLLFLHDGQLLLVLLVLLTKTSQEIRLGWPKRSVK